MSRQDDVRSSIQGAKRDHFVLDQPSCQGRVVIEETLQQPGLIERFAAWRENNQRPFLKLFNVTVEGTRSWVERIVHSDDRIMFLIEWKGKPVGHIGFGDFGDGFEICDVVRGESAPREVMCEALQGMIDWGRSVGIREVFLHVATNEVAAIGLYHRLGFVPTGLIPLRKMSTDGETVWEKASDEDHWDRFFMRMTHVE